MNIAAAAQRPGRRRPRRRCASSGIAHRVGHRAEAVARRGLPGPHRPRHRARPTPTDADDSRPPTTRTTWRPSDDHHSTTHPRRSHRRRDRRCPPTSACADTRQPDHDMAWRATLKMRRNFEQFFDVTIQPLLFTAMFAYIFGGAVSGERRGLPADPDPRPDRPDRPHRLRRHRRPAARGHGQGRLRPVPGAADRADRAAGRPDGRRHCSATRSPRR